MRKIIVGSALALAAHLAGSLSNVTTHAKRDRSNYEPFSDSRRPSLQHRDPKDPHQAQRIAAAAAKRARKAEKLYWDMNHAMRCNKAHRHARVDLITGEVYRHEQVLPHRLNPFYIEGFTVEALNHGGE